MRDQFRSSVTTKHDRVGQLFKLSHKSSIYRLSIIIALLKVILASLPSSKVFKSILRHRYGSLLGQERRCHNTFWCPDTWDRHQRNAHKFHKYGPLRIAKCPRFFNVCTINWTRSNLEDVVRVAIDINRHKEVNS